MPNHKATPLNIRPMQGTLYRFAPVSPYQATLNLTGNVRAANILARLLQSKSPPNLKGLPPLIQQALLCPMGPWASPMRSPGDPGLILGAAHLHTAVNACAQRQQQFLNSMPPHPNVPYLHSTHTLYSVTYNTPHGVSLRAIELPPEQTHTIAKILRGHNVAVATYPAADPLDEPDIGVLTANALENCEIQYEGTWVSEVSCDGTTATTCMPGPRVPP